MNHSFIVCSTQKLHNQSILWDTDIEMNFGKGVVSIQKSRYDTLQVRLIKMQWRKQDIL